MAEIVEVTQPYELLIRWDPVTGLLSGAHVRVLHLILKDGKPLHMDESLAIPVSMIKGPSDFPLDEVLTEMQIDALKAVEQHKAEIERLTHSIETLERVLAEERAAREG